MKKTIFIFGLLALSVLLLIHLGDYTLRSGSANTELILALCAIIFFFLGVLVYRKLTMGPVQKEMVVDYLKIKELEITQREYDVLRELAKNKSNKGIAEQLYLSESTIKTHVSSLLKKLEVENRLQLTAKAKELHLV